MDFLPKDYQDEVKYGNYTKLEEGENLIRVLSPAIMGYEWWEDKDDGTRKPIRIRRDEEIPMLHAEDARFFWAFTVWNYKAKKVQIMEITQSGIRKGILALMNNKKWGDVANYDLSITKTKTGSDARDVEYNVQPNPKEELPAAIADIVKQVQVNLDALYDGLDPFEKESIDIDQVSKDLEKDQDLDPVEIFNEAL